MYFLHRFSSGLISSQNAILEGFHNIDLDCCYHLFFNDEFCPTHEYLLYCEIHYLLIQFFFCKLHKRFYPPLLTQ